MSEIIIFSSIMIVAVFIAACSQILLKKETKQEHKNIISEYLNYRVICAYALFGISILMSIYVLRHIPLSLATVLETAGHVFVVILSWIFLCEKPKKQQLIGILLIIAGIIIYGIS